MSRRKRRAIIGLCVIAAVGLGALDRHFGGGLRQSIAHFGNDWDDYRKYHGNTFNVVKVVDGDTIDIDIPDGAYDHTRVRLLGVDTPETANDRSEAMYYGPEAKEFVTTLVEGKKITVIIDDVGDVRGKFGRLLGYVELEDGTILNKRIISEGYGYADLRFGHSAYDEYVQLQQKAIKDGTGLWKEAVRDQLPEWLKRQREQLLAD